MRPVLLGHQRISGRRRRATLILAGILFLSGCTSIASYEMLKDASDRMGEVQAVVLQLASDPEIPQSTQEALSSLLDKVSAERQWIFRELQAEEERRRNWWFSTLTTVGTVLLSSGILALLL